MACAGVAVFARGMALTFVIAVAVNYGWELAQAPLYADAAVAVVVRSLDWYMRPAGPAYLAMAAAGLFVGVVVEWWGLHIAERWRYSDLMPILPAAEGGLAPVLQMLVLPPAIFAAVRRLAV